MKSVKHKSEGLGYKLFRIPTIVILLFDFHLDNLDLKVNIAVYSPCFSRMENHLEPLVMGSMGNRRVTTPLKSSTL